MQAKNKNEFDQADEDGGSYPVTAVIDVDNLPEVEAVSGLMKFRGDLIRQYHNGAMSLLERMDRGGQNNTEQMVMEMVREVIRETDHLLGNELVATQNGNIRDASVISGKRAEVLQTAIKAVQAKQLMEKEGGIGVDPDSPSMGVVFKFFLYKVKIVFQNMGFDSELSDTFFRMYKDEMKDWRKELKADLEDQQQTGSEN